MVLSGFWKIFFVKLSDKVSVKICGVKRKWSDLCLWSERFVAKSIKRLRHVKQVQGQTGGVWVIGKNKQDQEQVLENYTRGLVSGEAAHNIRLENTKGQIDLLTGVNKTRGKARQ